MISFSNLWRRRHRWLRWPGDDVAAYIRGGRRPWSRGYQPYKEDYIRRWIGDLAFLERLGKAPQLPSNYGEFLDERVVEYPWFLSRVQRGQGRLLDAGSTLNHAHVLGHQCLKSKETTIVTLAPETSCFWQQRISYVFADMRDLPFRDDYFDEVVSISTVEHVGKDNTRIYTHDDRFKEDNNRAFLGAMQELKRVCRPGGTVYITVPFGRYTDFGWYQQFDAALIDELIADFSPARVRETYFHYEGGGWQQADKHSCGHLEGFDIHSTRYMNPHSSRDYDPDFAAASRGIAALELIKKGPQ